MFLPFKRPNKNDGFESSSESDTAVAQEHPIEWTETEAVEYLQNVRDTDGSWFFVTPSSNLYVSRSIFRYLKPVLTILTNTQKYSHGLLFRIIVTERRVLTRSLSTIDQLFGQFKNYLTNNTTGTVQIDVKRRAKLQIAKCHRECAKLEPGDSLLLFGRCILVDGVTNEFYLSKENSTSLKPRTLVEVNY